MLTITDDTGKQVRRLDLDKTPGLRRVAWNLRGDPPPPGAAAPAGAQGGFGGGRGGQPGPLVAPGRYRATLGGWPATRSRRSAPPQSFTVLPIELK